MSTFRLKLSQLVFLTVKDVADRLRVHPSTVKRWIFKGILPMIKPSCGRTSKLVISPEKFEKFIEDEDLGHVQGAPYHPQTQGKIERYHRTMKNVVKLENYFSPDELRASIESFVNYYNNERYHESLDNLTPADVYFGRDQQVKAQRHEIKMKTLKERRKINRKISV